MFSKQSFVQHMREIAKEIAEEADTHERAGSFQDNKRAADEMRGKAAIYLNIADNVHRGTYDEEPVVSLIDQARSHFGKSTWVAWVDDLSVKQVRELNSAAEDFFVQSDKDRVLMVSLRKGVNDLVHKTQAQVDQMA